MSGILPRKSRNLLEDGVSAALSRAIECFPLFDLDKDEGPPALRNVRRKAAFTTLKGATRILPYVSEETLWSIFEPKLRNLNPDQQVWNRQLLFSTRRLFASPKHRRAASKLFECVVPQLYDIVNGMKAFEIRYGYEAPSLIVISPTMRCNLRCYGCYAGQYGKKDDLDADLMSKVVREVKELGVRFVVISGGEPFFSEDVLRLWEEHPDVFFVVFTNGTLIDRAMAKRLARLGNVMPAISVEGFEKETDARRGEGVFAKVMAAMDNMRREGAFFGFSATAVRGNNELICSDEFVDFYINKGCVMGWYFNYIPIGREPDMELMPTPEQRVARWRKVRELRNTKPILISDFWCDGSLVGGCISAGRRYLHINHKGDAEPCVFAHFAVDNIRDKSLVEILNSPFFQAIRSRQPFSENLLRPCAIIDHPYVLREAVAKAGAHPTHEGAETIITQLAPALDRYSVEYGKVADDAWKLNYCCPVGHH